VRGAAVAPWQYVTGVVTVGASGKALTVTVISALGLFTTNCLAHPV